MFVLVTVWSVKGHFSLKETSKMTSKLVSTSFWGLWAENSEFLALNIFTLEGTLFAVFERVSLNTKYQSILKKNQQKRQKWSFCRALEMPQVSEHPNFMVYYVYRKLASWTNFHTMNYVTLNQKVLWSNKST